MFGTSWLGRLVVSTTITVSGAGAISAEDRPAARPLVQGGGAVLTAAVRTARSIALERIDRELECRDLFAARGADGARLLLDADYRVAQPGEAGGLCEEGATAFTGMTTRRTAICGDAFLKQTPHVRATILLHEALHAAGMGQHPHHPDGMTPRQIDAMLGKSCGL
jgi:hypothetical protein